MTSLSSDLSNGVKLVQLMEIMGDVSLGRYYKIPRMRVQMAENVNIALEFIKSRGVVLTNVGAEGELEESKVKETGRVGWKQRMERLRVTCILSFT